MSSGAAPGATIVTLHRSSNVDSAGMMARIGGVLKEIAAERPLIFPVHPRARGNLEKSGIDPGPAWRLVAVLAGKPGPN